MSHGSVNSEWSKRWGRAGKQKAGRTRKRAPQNGFAGHMAAVSVAAAVPQLPTNAPTLPPPPDWLMHCLDAFAAAFVRDFGLDDSGVEYVRRNVNFLFVQVMGHLNCREAVAKQREEAIGSREAVIEALQNEVLRLSKERVRAEEGYKKLEAKFEDMHSRFMKAEERNKTLEAELNDMHSGFMKAEERNKTLEAELNDMHSGFMKELAAFKLAPVLGFDE